MNKSTYIRKVMVWCLAAVSFGLLTRCAEEFESPQPAAGTTLSEIAAADTTLQIFSAAIAKTGIGISLANINSGQHTVFAPTDSAFRAYFQPIIGGGPGDVAIVNYVNNLSSSSNPTLAVFTARLQYHIISSAKPAADIMNSQVFTTINTARISLSKSGGTVYVNANAGANGAKVRVADLEGANGVIHEVNKFLTAISTGSAIGNTLGITVNYAVSPVTVTVGATSGNNYDLFANAIKKTGLALTVRPNVPAVNLPDYTFFAPDDAAMVTYLGTLSGGTVTDEASGVTYINGLTDSNLTTLTNVVKYHIAAGRVLSTDLTVDQNVNTLYTGKTFGVDALSPSVVLAGNVGGTATVTTGNVLTNAGVVHRLNSVLKPE
jgi:uncharacterized surface protein with fasciclin (FAS1) repeats